MRKLFILMALAVALITGSCVLSYDDGTNDSNNTTSVDSTQENEPNGSYNDADSLDVDQLGIGKISTVNDEDYWSIYLQQGTHYKARTYVPTGGDSMDMILLIHEPDESGYLLRDDDNGAGEEETRIWTPTQSGYWYVEIAGYDDSMGDYYVEVVEYVN